MKEETKNSVKLAFWCVIAGVVAIILYGFLSGSLVLGNTSIQDGEAMAHKEVIERLTPIHQTQFKQGDEK